MLSAKELGNLLNVLGEEDKPLEYISSQFHKTFAKAEQFKVACCLYLLLQDNLLPKLANRIAAFWILFDSYKGEPIASNPFLPIIVDTLQQKESLEAPERNFLMQLLGTPSKEVQVKKILFARIFRNLKIQREFRYFLYFVEVLLYIN